MSTKLQLTLAAGDYDSIAALKDGTVTPDGIELTILTDMTAEVRHARMLRGRQFDVAELSMSNYMVAKDNGLPFIAIPVFLHRRFRHGFAFVNTTKGIGQAHRPDRQEGSASAVITPRRIYGFAVFSSMISTCPTTRFTGSRKTRKKSPGKRRPV